MSLEELFKKYPWRSSKKFIPLARKHGFSEKEAKEILGNDFTISGLN